jgi:hypothetical protein
MASSPDSTRGLAGGARSGVIGTAVVGIGFFDGVFLGAPIALVTAAVGSPLVFVAAATAVACLVIVCCAWVDRSWDVWLSGNGARVETTLGKMRASRLMSHPMAWIQDGSDRRYALAAALANPILVLAFARSLTGAPIGERRILLGAVAYAIPYVAIWTLLGWTLGTTIRAA